jgi:ribosomal protein L11 methyltransferase
MAFGTGLHPTTRACLELLQTVEPMPSPVLDVGTGSGILALAALRLGASRAVGYDIDKLAVEASTANAQANDLGDRFRAQHGTLPDSAAESFPLVVANLVAAVLVEMAPRLAAHTAPGGTLIASGIIAIRFDEVEGALTAAGYEVLDWITEGDWVSVRLVPTP